MEIQTHTHIKHSEQKYVKYIYQNYLILHDDDYNRAATRDGYKAILFLIMHLHLNNYYMN